MKDSMLIIMLIAALVIAIGVIDIGIIIGTARIKKERENYKNEDWKER